jgi:hypothetical protein
MTLCVSRFEWATDRSPFVERVRGEVSEKDLTVNRHSSRGQRFHFSVGAKSPIRSASRIFCSEWLRKYGSG